MTTDAPCKTQKRNSRAVCHGMRKGHEGEHNFRLPDGSVEPVPPKPPKVADMSMDEQLELAAKVIKRDLSVLMNWLVDNPSSLEHLARYAQRVEKSDPDRMYLIRVSDHNY